MNILIVCSGNSGRISPFIVEQADALRRLGVIIEYYPIRRKGLTGYLQSAFLLRKAIRNFQPDLIHAHYGLSGLLANFQRRVPVITTFHGSDINEPFVRPLSKLCMWLSCHSVFISGKLAEKACAKNDFSVIPCGIDLDLFYPVDKPEARKKMNLDPDKKYVLFAGPFDDKVKNYPLAKAAIDQLENVRLIELKGYTRAEVNLLLNACDVALMTSFHEGSPQFIKEAMACNTPVVSVDVGDVAERISGMDACFISTYNPEILAADLQKAIQYARKTRCRETVSVLSNETVAKQILEIYRYIKIKPK